MQPRRFALVSLLAGVLAAGPALAAEPATAAAVMPTLRVMTFNVRYPSPDDGPNVWEKRRDLMVKTIDEAHPDIIGTQELWKKQGDYIVSRLPQYAWFGMGRMGGDGVGDEHMGVFYRTDRLRIVDQGNFWLSETPDVPGSNSWGQPFPRMVTWARFEVIGTTDTFVMYDTHFPYREGDTAIRNRCAQEIFEHLRDLPAGTPIVLTGDFNTGPDSQVHATLTQMLADTRDTAPKRSGPDKTFQDFTGVPDQRIDWILVRGFRALDSTTVTTSAGGRYPSDHFPVVVDLAWPSPPGR